MITLIHILHLFRLLCTNRTFVFDTSVFEEFNERYLKILTYTFHTKYTQRPWNVLLLFLFLTVKQ